MAAKTKRVRRWDSLTSAQQARVTFADVFAYIGREREDNLAWRKAEQARDYRREMSNIPSSKAGGTFRGSAGRGYGNGYWTGS